MTLVVCCDDFAALISHLKTSLLWVRDCIRGCSGLLLWCGVARAEDTEVQQRSEHQRCHDDANHHTCKVTFRDVVSVWHGSVDRSFVGQRGDVDCSDGVQLVCTLVRRHFN